MRVTRLLTTALLVCSAAAALGDDDPLRDAEVTRLVWEAVDSDEAEAALTELTGFPDVTWTEVRDVLAEGRPAELRTPPSPTSPLTELPAEALNERLTGHFEELAAFPWEPGVVRTYDLPDTTPWYTVATGPEPAFDASPPAVLFDLGAFAPQATAPEGWIVVRLHDALYHAPDLGGAPLSLTAGTSSQSIVLSVLRDLERRVAYDPDRVFLTGFSRGGNAALYFGVHWPDRFAGIVPAAGYYPIDDDVLPNLAHVAVLCAYGDDRGHRDANAYQKALARRLKSTDADVVEREQKGRATDGQFGADFMVWAGERRRDPLPRSVEYVLADPRHRGSYWVEILEVKDPGRLMPVAIRSVGGEIAERFRVHSRTAKVGVEIVGPNQIRLRARNVKRLRLMLSPELFDLALPVKIVIGPRTIERTPAPSVETLIEQFRATHDVRRLFPAVLDVTL